MPGLYSERRRVEKGTAVDAPSTQKVLMSYPQEDVRDARDTTAEGILAAWLNKLPET